MAISRLRLRCRRDQLSIQQLHPAPFSLRLVVGVQRDVAQLMRHDMPGLRKQIVALVSVETVVSRIDPKRAKNPEKGFSAGIRPMPVSGI